MTSRCEPIPALHGDDNLEEWKLKVVGTFATIGLADYLFSPNTPPPSPGKLALGMDILLPSLKAEAEYLSKAGWDFNARNQDPNKLYQLVLSSIPRRKVAVPINDELLKLLRIEMADGGHEAIDDYFGRIKGHRHILRRLGHVVEDDLLVRATLHGMVATGREDIKKCVNWLIVNELAPGNLTFEKLEGILRIAEPQDVQEMPVAEAAEIQPGHSTTWDAQREDHLASTSRHCEEDARGNGARCNPVFQDGHSTHAAQPKRTSSGARPVSHVNIATAETSRSHPSEEHVYARDNRPTSVANRCRSSSASNNNHQGYPIPNRQLRVINTPATINNYPSDEPPVSIRFVERGLAHECRDLPVGQRSVHGVHANVTSQGQTRPGKPQARPEDGSKTSTYPGRMSKSVPVPGAWPMSPASTL